MKQVSIFMLLTFLLFSCKQEESVNTNEKNPLSHSMPTMVDVYGVFEGDMPCEQCDKEMVTLDFKMDKSVIATIARVGGEGGSTAGIGTWELTGDQVKIDVSTGAQAYTVKGNQLQKKVGNKTYVLVKLKE